MEYHLYYQWNMYYCKNSWRKHSKEIFTDGMVIDLRYSVLRLLRYRCVFNPTEMKWHQLKHYSSQPKVCDQKVTVTNWKNCFGHIMKEQRAFWEIDHTLENETEQSAFHLLDQGDRGDCGNELVWNIESKRRYKPLKKRFFKSNNS